MEKLAITGSTYGTCTFDADFEITPQFTNTITQNPVQTGADINDHVFHQPILLTVKIGVSDVVTIFSSRCFTSDSRSLEAFTFFKQLWANSETLTIVTEWDAYQNMVVKSFTPQKDKTTMHALRATVIFQQIIVTQAVSISVSQKTTSDPQITGSNSGGNKATSSGKATTVKIKSSDYSRNIQVKYGGKTYSLEDYLVKYANQTLDVDNGILTLTLEPILSSSIASSSTFVIGGESLDYNQFVKKYS